MKKSELIAFGIPEDRLKEFQKAYWADVRTSAQNVARRELDTKAADIRTAIVSMINIMPDRDKLLRVMTFVNKQYYQMCREADKAQEPALDEGSAADCQ